MATSFGNAGVLSSSTVLNANNPSIYAALPDILLKRSPAVSYRFLHAVGELRWIFSFLKFSGRRHVGRIAANVQRLQALSLDRHRELIAEAGVDSILAENGWLKVYRDRRAYDSSRLERELMDRLKVEYSTLAADELADAEPALRPDYPAGLLMTGTCSVRDPLDLSRAYLKLYSDAGGDFHSLDVKTLEVTRGRWTIFGGHSRSIEADNVVIACGPWSADVCRPLGYRIPLSWERGYHVNLRSPDMRLRRPVHDVQRGFVMAPQGGTTRVTTGVEFAHRDAAPDFRQVRRVAKEARQAAGLGEPVGDVPWLGSRPTLPDGLPMIGMAGRDSGLWFNFGHQHIGMSTSTGSAILLADLITGQETTEVDCRPYCPARFGA